MQKISVVSGKTDLRFDSVDLGKNRGPQMRGTALQLVADRDRRLECNAGLWRPRAAELWA